MSTVFNLQFGGVPFVSDTATIIRQSPPEIPPGQVDEQTPIRKQQPEVNLIDELNRLIPFHNLNDFRLPAGLDKNLAALARRSPTDPNPEGVRIGEWYYPVGASRWSVFRGLATSSQVRAMLAATYQPDNPTPPQWTVGSSAPARAFAGSIPALFSMTAQPLNPVSELGYTIETSMYMLPPRPLGETLGSEGLFLITLVDERFFWAYAPTSAFMTVIPSLSTWTGYVENLAMALGVAITFSSSPPIPEFLAQGFSGPQYTGPEPDSQLWINMENCAVLLDAVAYNLGCKVVRNLNGTYTLQRPQDSAIAILTNREETDTLSQRLAGGNIFDTATGLNTGSRAAAVNQVLPSSINVSFPLYCPLNAPVPHFLNPRTITAQRPSAWYEESYGDVWIQNVPISTVTSTGNIGVVSATGSIGADNKIEVAPYVHAVHTTAKALVPNDGSLSLLNAAGIVALAQQIAIDYYAWQGGLSLDEVYPGTVAWQPEGGHDVVWTYSERARLASCRVTRTIWNAVVREMQHTTPTAPGAGVYTNNPPGVGGKTVAQSWKDSYDAYISSALTLPMEESDTVAYLETVDNLPTQNRWNALIDEEIIQFDGTSGGILASSMDGVGYLVTVAQPNAWNSEGGTTYARGIESTLPASHLEGAVVTQITPNMTHGVNVVTTEKGQFAHPSDWGEGIQGANLKPQVQTIFIWSASGQSPNISGIFPYYSGSVVIYPQLPESQGYRFAENVWVQERNNSPIVSGKYYEGQLFGYSVNPYRDQLGDEIPTEGAVAPVYLVNQDSPAKGETAIITIDSLEFNEVVLKGQAQNCTILVYPGTIWSLVYDGNATNCSGSDCPCTYIYSGNCWFLPGQQEPSLVAGPQNRTNPIVYGSVPALFVKVVGRLGGTDSNGIPIYTRDIENAFVQVTSLKTTSITLADGGTLTAYPANVQLPVTGTDNNGNKIVTWQLVTQCYFFPADESANLVPKTYKRYSCQLVGIAVEGSGLWIQDPSANVPTHAEVWSATLDDTDFISIATYLADRISISNGTNTCSIYAYPAYLWQLINCQWTAVGNCWYMSANMDLPPIGVRFLAKHEGSGSSDGLPVFSKETLSAVVRVVGDAQIVTNGNSSLLAYSAQKDLLINGAFGDVVLPNGVGAQGQIWFTPLNNVTPSGGRRYNCQLVGIDNRGIEIWGDNPSDTAVITVLSSNAEQIQASNNGIEDPCPIYAYPAERWILFGCEWISDGLCWYTDPDEENPVPPLCVRFVAKQVEMEASTGLGVYTKEVTQTIIQVIDSKSQKVSTCDSGGAGVELVVYPAQVVVMESGAFTTIAAAWFYPLDNGIPTKGGYYNCQIISREFGTDIGVWAADIGPQITAANENTPINFTFPLKAIYANNDQGSSAFGRIFFKEITTQTDTLEVNWQGLRVTTSDAWYGPEPDVEFVDSECLSWIVSDNTANKVISIEASLDLTCISNFVINYIITNSTTIFNNNFFFPFLLEAYNVNAPKNDTKPVYTLIANNDLGSYSFGRIFFSQTAANTLEVNWQGILALDSAGDIIGPWPNLEFINSNTVTWSLASDAANEAIKITANVAPKGLFVISNSDCVNPVLYPPATFIQADNTVGGTPYPIDCGQANCYFGHIVWVPQDQAPCTYTGPVQGPGGFLSWQGLRLQDGEGNITELGEDIILQGTFCPGGSKPTINVTVDNEGRDVQALFTTLGCNGILSLCYIDEVTFNTGTCTLTTYTTNIQLNINCGLITNVKVNWVHSSSEACNYQTPTAVWDGSC